MIDSNKIQFSGMYNPQTNKLYKNNSHQKKSANNSQKNLNIDNLNIINWAKTKCLNIMANNHFENLIEFGWCFKWNNTKRSAGKCSFGKEKIIFLSHFITQNHDKIMILNTITHEIAHAIDCEKRGTSDHSLLWKNIHIKLGGTGNRTYKDNIDLDYKYVSICPNHGEISWWLRKPKYLSRSCKICRSSVEIKKLR